MAGRNTPQWEYAQTLTEAFHIVGVTQLFDMLEEAEQKDMCIELTYHDSAEFRLNPPYGIQLISREYPVNRSDKSLLSQ